MRLQLMVSFLFITLMLAGVAGHAAWTPCKSPANSPARAICEDLRLEYQAAHGTYVTFYPSSRQTLSEMRTSLQRAYDLARQPNPNVQQLENLYGIYRASKAQLQREVPAAYRSFFESATTLRRDDPRDARLATVRAERLKQAFDRQTADRLTEQRRIEEETRRLAREAEERRAAETRAAEARAAEEKRAALERADSMRAQAAAQRADRAMTEDWSQVPRCFSSGFAVATDSKRKNRCERVTDRDGMLRAMRLSEAKGLENLGKCGSGMMLCNPFTFGATKKGNRVQPLCVRASINASADCTRRSGTQHKAFRAELLRDPKNLAALHGLHRNLDNSCGLTEEQQSRGVTMAHVIRAGRSLGTSANERIDDKDFIRTCKTLLGLTSPIVAENPIPARGPSTPVAGGTR